jgi:hypothetical protein
MERIPHIFDNSHHCLQRYIIHSRCQLYFQYQILYLYRKYWLYIEIGFNFTYD